MGIDYIDDLSQVKFYTRPGGIRIVDSYRVKKKDFKKVFDLVKEKYPDTVLFKNRSLFSLKMEWSAHNFLYKRNVQVEKVKDVDLDYEMIPFERFVYNLVGLFSWIFIK